VLDDLLRSEEFERERIATELHDDTIQVIIAALVTIDRAARDAHFEADVVVELGRYPFVVEDLTYRVVREVIADARADAGTTRIEVDIREHLGARASSCTEASSSSASGCGSPRATSTSARSPGRHAGGFRMPVAPTAQAVRQPAAANGG
jgi:hypothetical protein